MRINIRHFLFLLNGTVQMWRKTDMSEVISKETLELDQDVKTRILAIRSQVLGVFPRKKNEVWVKQGLIRDGCE